MMLSKIERMNDLLKKQRHFLESDISHDHSMVNFLESSLDVLARGKKKLIVGKHWGKHSIDLLAESPHQIYATQNGSDEENYSKRHRSPSPQRMYATDNEGGTSTSKDR